MSGTNSTPASPSHPVKAAAAKIAFLLPSLILIGLGTATGAMVLGVVIPVTLFLISAMYFDDMGGPLFWPIFVLLMLLVGTGLGFVFSILWVLMFWLLRLLIPAQYRS